MRTLLTCALVAAALPMAAQSVSSANANGKATAVIQAAPAGLVWDGKTLNFGVITASSTGSVITIAPGADNADSFTFTKDINEVGAIGLPTSITLAGASATANSVIIVDTFKASSPLNVAGETTGPISVGATIRVPAWAKKGTYAANYPVTFSYNQL
jgi:hypothetical protein